MLDVGFLILDIKFFESTNSFVDFEERNNLIEKN